MITPGHKRALNRALHELRRPLQTLLLLEDGGGRPAAAPPRASRRGLLELVTTALQDLDGVLNGGSSSRPFRRFSCRESLMACLERWRPHAASAGGIRVYWDAGPAMIEGDAARLAQALDNLVSNALEHGGPPIVVTGARVAGRVRITVANGIRTGRMAAAPTPGTVTGPTWSPMWPAPMEGASRSATRAAAALRRSSCPWPSRVTRARREPPRSGARLPGRGADLRAARRHGRGPLPLPPRGSLWAAQAGRRGDLGAGGRASRSAPSGRRRRSPCAASRRALSRPGR